MNTGSISRTLLLFALLAAIPWGLLYYLKTDRSAPGPATPTAEEAFVGMSGSLFLTLGDFADNRARMYVYNFEDSALEELHGYAEGNEVLYYPTPLPDGELLYGAAPYAPNDLYQVPYTESLALYKKRGASERTLVSNADRYARHNPTLSPDGTRYVFADIVNPTDSAIQRNIDDWAVFVGDVMTGEEVRVDSGVSPQWSPDGKYIFYLRDTGMYRHVLEEGRSEIAIDFYSPLDASFDISVSREGGLLVFSNLLAQKLFVMPISSAGDLLGRNVLELQHPVGFMKSPVFSPDGKYVAYVLETHAGGFRRLDSIEIVSVASGERQTVLKFEDQQFSAVELPALLWSAQ